MSECQEEPRGPVIPVTTRARAEAEARPPPSSRSRTRRSRASSPKSRCAPGHMHRPLPQARDLDQGLGHEAPSPPGARPPRHRPPPRPPSRSRGGSGPARAAPTAGHREQHPSQRIPPVEMGRLVSQGRAQLPRGERLGQAGRQEDAPAQESGGVTQVRRAGEDDDGELAGRRVPSRSRADSRAPASRSSRRAHPPGRGTGRARPRPP